MDEPSASQYDGTVSGYAYILAAKKNGTLYTGVTADLARRVWVHKQRQGRGFTAIYGAVRLVWYRGYQDIGEAIVAEKRIKKWQREWKIRLIEGSLHNVYGMGPGLAAVRYAPAANRDDARHRSVIPVSSLSGARVGRPGPIPLAL